MIDNLTIERIQSAAQIYDVVSDFITLRKRGVNYVGLCPFHEDKTPSFYVSPAKNICKCFACGEGGTPIHFIMKHEQLSYVEALKHLAKKYGIEVKETELSDEQKQAQGDREAMFILNGFAQKTFTNNLFDTKEGRDIALSYFEERGFREDIIKKFQLGYCLDQKDSFTQQAIKSGYKQEYLEKTGLTFFGENNYQADRFRGRVMFPVHTISGKVIAFGGRTLKKDDKAKYVNSPESEIYHKSNELYGIYFARQSMVKYDKCFLVEGYTDVISMHQAGIENVVASSGTALTLGQIRLIHRFTANVTVLYDGDSAGIKAAVRGIDLLLEAGLNIKIVLLPEGEDPDSFSKKQSASSFIEYIKTNEVDFVQFKADLLIKDAGNDPVKKANIITEVVNTIALIPEEIIRSLYVKECSRLLGVDERLLVHNIAKKRQEILVQKKKTIYPDPENPDNVVGATETIPTTPIRTDKDIAISSFPLDKYEREILEYVIKYGTQTMTYKDPETQEAISFRVIDFIVSDLVDDELAFENPKYKRILDEAYEYSKQENPNLSLEQYLLNHIDTEISQLVIDISTERYILGKRYTQTVERINSEEDKAELEKEKAAKFNQMLLDKVPYLMFNYKDAIIKQKEKDINEKIMASIKDNNISQQLELVKELLVLQDFKKTIARQLGERIVVRM
ncbi:DNA primase [Dysgonomonadaceae bacterium PH5-43]|nr:DNA primase [Dysgonomonadaceae bacterium PH5-43]